MARADLLLSLVKAAASGDRALTTKTVEAMVAEERAKNHGVLADQLEAQVRKGGLAMFPEPTVHPSNKSDAAGDLFQECQPRRRLSELVLGKDVKASLSELLAEHSRSDLLRAYNLSPRHRVLLVGAPGNGKTSVAEALATGLMVPLVKVRYDALITSYLGETSSRLKRLFELSRSKKCVLFFDEFDTIGKERGDIHETGEIKRVVSSLLMQIDDLPPHVVVVCATNHPELLDRAVWRRFQMRLSLEKPTPTQIEEYLAAVEQRLNVRLGASHRALSTQLKGASFSDLEGFVEDVLRRYVLALPEADMAKRTRNTATQWKSRITVTAPRKPRA